MSTDTGGGVCLGCRSSPTRICAAHHFGSPNTTDDVDREIAAKDARIAELETSLRIRDEQLTQARLATRTAEAALDAEKARSAKSEQDACDLQERLADAIRSHGVQVAALRLDLAAEKARADEAWESCARIADQVATDIRIGRPLTKHIAAYGASQLGAHEVGRRIRARGKAGA